MGNETYEGYERVSAILDVYQDPELIDWKIRVGKKESKRISKVATDIGTNVDEYIKAEIQGLKLPKLKTQEAENCVRAWRKWVEDYRINFNALQCGERLFNEETKVCGEPDILLVPSKEVLDIKCSSSIRQSYWLQTNWYAQQLGYEGRSILRLDKNLGIYEYEARPVSDEESMIFKCLTVIYRYFKPVKEEDDVPSSIAKD